MERNTLLYIDVDGVIADLGPVWLGIYNADFDDNLTVDDLVDWDLHNLVKPECGTKIYDYLKNPALYDTVKPYDGALEAINHLKHVGHRIVYPTATPFESAGRKFFWLNDWGFKVDKKDYIEINDKSLLKGGYLLDDGYHNVRAFWGTGYLWTRPWNKGFIWSRRITDWYGFIKAIEDEMAWEEEQWDIANAFLNSL